ncbi:MAG TPA: hypothetical protein VNY52_04640 [Solirubrobacteraceae bacterium]|jgi:hypothetical protein|nr:hypothetical protein [Solirubrobacteraceae bacterium]
MRAREHDAKNASTPKPGVFAQLGAFVRSPAGTVRTLRPYRGAVVLVAVVGLAASATGVLASNPIHIEAQPHEDRIFSTRAVIQMAVADPENVPVEWRAEVAPALGNGEAPPPPQKPGEAPWTPAGGSVEPVHTKGQLLLIALGYEGVPGEPDIVDGVLHHLKPETSYYARFVANSSTEESTQSVKFDTGAIAKPEIHARMLSTEEGFLIEATGRTTAIAKAHMDSNGAQTTYHFEYSLPEEGHVPAENSPSWKLFTSGAEGLITVPADFADLEAKLTGLTPETTYYARVKATNEKGTRIQGGAGGIGEGGTFTTLTARPSGSSEPSIRNVTAGSAHLADGVNPQDSETRWHFEYTSEPGNPGSWVTVPGAEGTISQAEAEALEEAKAKGEGFAVTVDATVTGLRPSTVYSVRLFAENAAGEEQRGIASFETSGPPSATTFALHGLDGESLRLVGSVNPNSHSTTEEQAVTLEGSPTGGTFTLTFKGQTTVPIAYNASVEAVARALEGLPAIGGGLTVDGTAGGPYTVYFGVANLAEASQPMLEAASGLTPTGSVKVAVTQQGGEAYDTHYHFEYVSEEDFKVDGWARATSTAPVDVGHSRPPAREQAGNGTLEGTETDYVGADLPALTPGETYRYRISAVNTSPGEKVISGEEQTLAVPVLGPVQPPAACPNEATRTGLSGLLPDCRAYEQLTPNDKGGAQEIFNYGGNVAQEGAIVGSDGERLEYGSRLVKWGNGPHEGQSPYFFSRTESGWRLTAATAQPEAGVDVYRPEVLAPDLTALGLEAQFSTSPTSLSTRVEFQAGPPGGPYTALPPVPRAQAAPGWVAASADFSKLILEVEDHALLGHPTHTVHGDDLYEYSGGGLRQANVDSSGKTIGSCGATIAGAVGASEGGVSADGRRVFFEAVPSANCSEPKHTYVRVDGGGEAAQTLDLGAYRFLAANPDGSSVLLDKRSGENPGLYLYTAESGKAVFLPSSGVVTGVQRENLFVSEDLSAVYIVSGGDGEGEQLLYRYDVPARRLLLVTPFAVKTGHNSFYSSSPDGRYFYFAAGTVAGLPGGGRALETPHSADPDHGQTMQVYRYDSAESLVQCMSCASAFDPEPRLSALFTNATEGGNTIASANGDYVFFDTPAALLPSDVDGEIAPEQGSFGGEHSSISYSVSSDVYEWRRYGLDGCSHVQGCLALVTSGRGGFENILLGTTGAGRDVFFATRESLLPSDNDTAADIYDARIGGGFPEPPRTVECEGDACATPFAPPSDLIPSSAIFRGAGNLLVAAHSEARPKPKSKSKAKARCKRQNKRTCHTRATTKSVRKAMRREHVNANGRVGR